MRRKLSLLGVSILLMLVSCGNKDEKPESEVPREGENITEYFQIYHSGKYVEVSEASSSLEEDLEYFTIYPDGKYQRHHHRSVGSDNSPIPRGTECAYLYSGRLKKVIERDAQKIETSDNEYKNYTHILYSEIKEVELTGVSKQDFNCIKFLNEQRDLIKNPRAGVPSTVFFRFDTDNYIVAYNTTFERHLIE